MHLGNPNMLICLQKPYYLAPSWRRWHKQVNKQSKQRTKRVLWFVFSTSRLQLLLGEPRRLVHQLSKLVALRLAQVLRGGRSGGDQRGGTSKRPERDQRARLDHASSLARSLARSRLRGVMRVQSGLILLQQALQLLQTLRGVGVERGHRRREGMVQRRAVVVEALQWAAEARAGQRRTVVGGAVVGRGGGGGA